jgi:murein L,D-transpeptidase YcbB/YkuD
MMSAGKTTLTLGLGSALALLAGPALGQAAQTLPPAPESILPVPAPKAPPSPAPSASPTAAPVPGAVPPAAQPSPGAVPVPPEQVIAAIDEPVMKWPTADAQALLTVIKGIAAEGLIPADYEPDQLAGAILAGEGEALDKQASRSFAWLIEDMRDGRTRMESRVQWFVVDKDVEQSPVTTLMALALETHDIAAAVQSVAPTHPDYVRLRDLLARTPKADTKARNLIRVNMDRWRWLPREMGTYYLLTNVPEFQLRLTVRNEVIRSYRTVVGKPGKTATPQLADVVENVVFNPTWTVPQSIVVGEGLGAQLLANPKRAARENYKVTKYDNGWISVVQQPGDGNSLGRMKIDMPNEHAIYLHDTPAKALFNVPVRAFSHGCIRTERAVELGMTIAILGAGMTPQKATEIHNSKVYTKVPLTKTFPVYLTYFTMASDIAGKMGRFADIYGRDAPVLAAFNAPRKPWDGVRQTSEAVIKLDNPL